MEATKEQKKAIRRNCKYDVNIKEELVQWATEDNNKTSLNDLSFEQAEKILCAQEGRQRAGNRKRETENWGMFDKNNSKHKYILSLLRQLGLVKELKGRDVADIDKLSDWLKSDRSPVRKPLKKMNEQEVSKVIHALEEIIKKKWK